MSLHSRMSPPAPSFSCCPGFLNVAPGKLRENGRESVGQHLPPASLSLPLLPVWAGLPEGSQASEAEGREHSPPPPGWGMGQPPREWGERGKASPPALAEGERVQHCQGSKSKTEDGGGQRSPAIHPPIFWYWTGLLLLVPPRSPSLAAPCQEQGCHWPWKWEGERAGWCFPCGVPENMLFPHCVVTNISICECVYVHVCVSGGGVGGLFQGSHGCSMQCSASSVPPYPKSHFG